MTTKIIIEHGGAVLCAAEDYRQLKPEDIKIKFSNGNEIILGTILDLSKIG